MEKKVVNKADVVIMDGNIELMMQALAAKKVVLAAIELGANAQKTVETGWSDHFKAHAQLKGPTDTGTCFCSKPATHLVYFWRD